jgi:peptidyl-tRNA hydrolase
LGIGPVPENSNKADFVLQRFRDDEKEQVEKMIDTAAEAILFAFRHPLDNVMAKYNTRNPAQPEST